MTTKLTFQNPPVNNRGHLDHAEVVRQLKAKPGKWAKVPGYDAKTDAGQRVLASQIGKAQLKAYRPAGSFEAVSRKDPKTGEIGIWARYVGKGKSS